MIDETEADISRGEQEVADGERRLEQAKAELQQKRAEGQKRLDMAYARLIDGEAQRSDGKRRLDEARAKVDEVQRAIDKVDGTIAKAMAALSDVEAAWASWHQGLVDATLTEEEYNGRLDESCAQINEQLQLHAGQAGMDAPIITRENFADGLETARQALSMPDDIPITAGGERMTLGEAQGRLETAKRELAAAEAEYDSKVAELDDGWSQYYDGKATYGAEVAQAERQIADGQAQLDSARTQIADAKEQVKEGRRLIAESEPRLAEAKERLASLVEYGWSVMPRAYNVGVVDVSTLSGVTDKLSISMATLFLVVGLLVSYFVVSRIVQEHMTQIGTKKALGFRTREITAGYLLYSGSAVVAGAIVGALVGYFVVEGVIGDALGGMFTFGAYPAHFGWGLFLVITLAQLALVLGATHLACRDILRRHAVELLSGERPPAGKARPYERWAVWERQPLLVQTIVNNCVNDRRRVLSTIAGVAGCTALIVTAITFNNDVLKTYDIHYENVYGFNAIAYADFRTDDAINNVDSALRREGATTAQAYKKLYRLEQPDGESGFTYVIVPADGQSFAQLYHVNATDGGAFDLAGEGGMGLAGIRRALWRQGRRCRCRRRRRRSRA